MNPTKAERRRAGIIATQKLYADAYFGHKKLKPVPATVRRGNLTLWLDEEGNVIAAKSDSGERWRAG